MADDSKNVFIGHTHEGDNENGASVSSLKASCGSLAFRVGYFAHPAALPNSEWR